MDWRDYVTAGPEFCHGKACITGTRVLVTTVLDSLATGLYAETIVEGCPSLTHESVQAAVSFAAERAEALPSGCGRRG